MARTQLVLQPLADYAPEVGIFLAALEEARQRTKEVLDNVPADKLDWTPHPKANSLGTLLYHIAAIKMDWLYSEILEQPFPEEVMALFPHEVRMGRRLTVVEGVRLEEHLQCLATTRTIFLNAMKGMTVEDFYRVRHLESYDVTPVWVIHHLMQHEAVHRAQTSACCRRSSARQQKKQFVAPTP